MFSAGSELVQSTVHLEEIQVFIDPTPKLDTKQFNRH